MDILLVILLLAIGFAAGMTGYFWTSKIIPRSDSRRSSCARSIMEAVAGVVLMVLALYLAVVFRDRVFGDVLENPRTTEWAKTLLTSVALGGCYSIAYATMHKIFFRSSRFFIHLVVLIPAVIAEFAILFGVLWSKITSSTYFCAVMTLLIATLCHTNCFAWWLSYKKVQAEKL